MAITGTGGELAFENYFVFDNLATMKLSGKIKSSKFEYVNRSVTLAGLQLQTSFCFSLSN